MGFLGALTLNQMLAALLEALTGQIRDAGKEDDYCSITVQPGNAVPVDFGPESDCRGTAWVRLVSASPTVSFPNADLSVNNCAYELAYVVEVGMFFPAPMMEDQMGNFALPSDMDQFEAAQRQGDEMALMYRAIQDADVPQKLVGSYIPQGPEGGVLGGLWTLTIGADD